MKHEDSWMLRIARLEPMHAKSAGMIKESTADTRVHRP